MGSVSPREMFEQSYMLHTEIVEAAICDILAVFQRDPAVYSFLSVLLNFKGGRFNSEVHNL